MPDFNEIARQLAGQTGGDQTIDKLRAALSSPEGQKAAKIISSQNADTLERAAQAVQRGDMAEAARLANQLMQTGEGATLANQIRSMLFPK